MLTGNSIVAAASRFYDAPADPRERPGNAMIAHR
jgi:hypothetical protein